MMPLLEPGQRILIRPLDRETFPGDILVYSGRNGMTGHRLKGFSKVGGQLRIVTQGDACLFPDEPVEPTQLMGQICPQNNECRMFSLGNPLV